MDEMLALHSDLPSNIYLRQLFLERLPIDMRTQLVRADFSDPRQMAEEADALWESRDNGAGANAVRQRTPSPPHITAPTAGTTRPRRPT